MELSFEDLGIFYWFNFLFVGVAAYFFFKGKAKVAAGWLCIAHMLIMVSLSLYAEILITKYPNLVN